MVDVGVQRQVYPAGGGKVRHATNSVEHLLLQPVLRQRGQRLRRQADIADGVNLEQLREKRFQPRPGDVRHIPAGHDDITHRRCGAQVVQHSVLPVGRLQGQPGLADRWCGIADQIHPRAVPAILRAGREHFGEDLGRVSMGQPLHHPHLALVQRVSLGVRM